MRTGTRLAAVLGAVLAVLIGGCASRPGRELARRGDEIVIAGRYFHTGAPVVLWTDPGGYDGYRVERRFAPVEASSWEATAKAKAGPETPNRYGTRGGIPPETLERVRGGGWTLDDVRERVDQFVLHYDVCGTSRRCFEVLHDHRGLSVHFMIDVDGTIYQTLDVKERAWHATTSNDRSVGVEIANIGAYGDLSKDPFGRWYEAEMLPGPKGTVGFNRRTRLKLSEAEQKWIRTPGFVGYAARDGVVFGDVQGQRLAMHDFTPEQYRSLRRLTATLCAVLPKIRRDYPRDAEGRLVTRKLDDDALKNYSGVLGHFHVQENKVDPGPAMQWDYVVGRTSSLERH